MTEIPGGLVADVQASLELIGGNSLLGFCHEVYSEEPFPEGQMRVMENRSRRDRELITASITIKLAALLYAAYLVRTATRAFNAIRPFEGFQTILAFFLISILLNKAYQINVHGAPP